MLKGVSAMDPAINELEKVLAIYKNKNIVVFTPYGIGNHIDHLLIRKVGEALFDNLVVYSDFPYNIRFNNYGQTPSGFTRCEYKPDMAKKIALIKMYKTQVTGLFSSKVPDHKEVYFVNKQMADTK